MSKYIIWRWGLRGPHMAVTNSGELDEYDRHHMIAGPTKLQENEEFLPLHKLAQLYPAPVGKEYPDKPHNSRKAT